MNKPSETPLYLLPFLYRGTSDEYWYRRVRDGRLPISTGQSKARNRTTPTRELEGAYGALTSEQFESAFQAYAAARMLRVTELETTSGRAPPNRTEKRRARPAVSTHQ